MGVYDYFIKITTLAVILMFLGAWFITFASRMMRSADLKNFRKALRLNVFAIAIYWLVWVSSFIWPQMEMFSRQMAANIALAIGLLLIFRYVKDVTVTKKVVIWFVWCALDICVVILYAALTGI